MNLSELGIVPTSIRRGGTAVGVTCSLTEVQIHPLLRVLPVGAEVSAPDPESGDCYREAKRTSRGYELKRGCHGSYGEWRSASIEEASAWLSAGLASFAKFGKPGYGVGIVVPHDAYEG